MNPELDRIRNFAMLFFFLFAILFLTSTLRSAKKPVQGYGGAPGHMSPMEVEALYEKNKKP